MDGILKGEWRWRFELAGIRSFCEDVDNTYIGTYIPIFGLTEVRDLPT